MAMAPAGRRSSSRFIVPKNRREKVLCLLMAVLIPSTVVWEFGVVLPNYHRTIDSIVVFHALFCAFVVANIFGNLLLVMRTDASGRHSFLPSVQKPDWKYCHECQLNSPPRAYHCVQCNECVLKRDHHCMFTGCCIGYHNHRYFVVAVAYILIGSTYAVVYQWQYCLAAIGGKDGNGGSGYRWSTLLSLIAPHMSLAFGLLDFRGFVASLVQIISALVVLFSGYLTVVQATVVFNGQTQHERSRDIRRYDLGWRRNVADVLGARWPLVWLFPTVDSPLIGDGIRFATADDKYEQPKAI